ncbi:MAG: T9SS type A sorting domain-containing protein [Bacteroidota bacterium]
MNIFKKILLLTCVTLLVTHFSWSQTIVTNYNCTGSGSATLSVSPSTGITAYSWKSTTGTFTASTATITQASGTYSVTITKSTGTTAISAVTIASNIVPTAPTVSPATVSTSLCPIASSSQTLTASTASNYSWSRNGTVLSPAVTANSLSVLGNSVGAGTYNYSVTTTNTLTSCTATSNSVAITILAKPAAPIISPATVTNPICGTATQTLTASNIGSSVYVWKRDGSTLSSTTNSTLVTGTDVSNPGTYNYTVSSQNSTGCISDDSAPVSLKVSPKPSTPIITPSSFTPNVICGTDFKTLTATGGGAKYNWKRGGVLVTSSTAGNTLNVIGTDVLTGGTYTYTVSLENSVGCVSDDSQAGVVLQLFPTIPAKPTITANGATTFCQGGSVTLNSSYNSNANIWSRTSGADTITTFTTGIVIRTVGANSFTVKAKDANGCTSPSSNSFAVTINPLPTAPVIDRGVAVSICDLDSIVLSSNNKGTGSYLWNNNKTTQAITVKNAGSYSLTFTDANSCTSLPSLSTVLTLNPLPVKPIIAALRSLEFCFKDFTTLRASTTTSPATFEWDYNGFTGAQIDVALTTRSTQTELIKVSVKSISDKGCKSREASDVTTITVNPLPTTPTISANGPLTFCPDSTVILTSTDSPNQIYKWINTRDNSEFSDKKSVEINKTGKYYVRTISLKGCISDTSANKVITVREAPQAATILPSPITATVCDGGRVTMKALVANGNVNRYSWRDESTQREVSSEQEVSVLTSGNFSVKVRDTFGCFAAYSKVLKVTVNSLPTKPSISVIKAKIFCEEDSTIVQSSLPSTTSNGNKNLYTWFVDGQQVFESNSRQFSWKKASAIAVAITDSNGCKAPAVSDTIRTTVNPLPASPSITVRGAIPFCADKNVTLSASGTNGVTFKWITGATTPNITINTAGNITVQSVNGFGCLSKPSPAVDVRVNQLPTTPKLTANGETIFCDGSRVRIVSSSPFQAYWWRSTADSVGKGEDATSIFAAKTGNYFAKVQDSNGCISLASATIAVDARPNPTPTIIKKIGTFSLDAQGVGDEEGYIWRYNGDLQQNLTTRIIKAKKDGDYQVQASITYTNVALTGGKLVCYSNTSEVIKYVRDLSFEGMSVFPNPSPDGIISVEVIEDLVGANVIIYDLYGQLIADYKVDKFNTLKRIQLPNYHGDTYIVKVITDGYEKTRKVVTLRQ